MNLVAEGCQEQMALSCLLMLKVATQMLSSLESRLEMHPKERIVADGWRSLEFALPVMLRRAAVALV